MRINEAYEHEPILPYAAEEACERQTCERQSCGCDKTVVQCVDISAPLALYPRATVGTVVVSCQGAPTVTCSTDPGGDACNVLLTQRVCVSIPVRYSVEPVNGEPTIDCNCSTGCGC